MNWQWVRRPDLRLASAASEAFRAFSTGRATRRRAVVLCHLGDQLALLRPPHWERRSRRAYQGAIRRFETRASRPVPPPPDPAAVAHALLHETRRPYRRLAAVLARLGALTVVGLAVIITIASIASPRARAWFFPPDLAATAAWTASSALAGTASAGKGARSDNPYFFHTDVQDRPWLQITLPRAARVRKIRIENRGDCCRERALPLNVEVPDGKDGKDGKDWRVICQRRAPFSTWTCHPPPNTTTNIIRIEIPGQSMLHLKRVSVFE